MFLGYSSCWEKPQKQAVGQVPLGTQGHCPPAVRQTLRDGTFHRRRLNLAAGRFLPLPPQKNTPTVPGDSSLPPSCHGAAAVTSVYDTAPSSFPAPPALSCRPNAREAVGAGPGAPLPTWTRRLLPGDQKGTGRGPGVQEGPAGGSPPAPFLVDALFSGLFFPPIFLPPCGVHSSQRSHTRNVVIGWAAGPTPGERIEPLQA